MSASRVAVRPAALADVPGLVALVEATELPLGVQGSRHAQAAAREHLDQHLAALLIRSDRVVLIAESDGELVGMVIAADDEVGVIAPTPVLRTSHFVVHPAQRRRGIGRCLLAGVAHLAEERGIDHVVATTPPGFRDVNRYLARLGFHPLVSRRIASIAVLRRELGVGDAPERVAMARRARIVRSTRTPFLARAAGRGA